MPLSVAKPRRDALQIWQSGVDAVHPRRLVPQWLRVESRSLVIGDEQMPLDRIRRMVVVGGGKASAAMAEAVEDVLGPKLMADKRLAGWVNVPADCVRPLTRIHLHAARPPGINEPTAEGVVGSQAILRIVESLGPEDLCICLLSGGGSALMPYPVDGVTLADKIAVTQFLSAAGANIEQMNTVRKQLSRIKGGGLARACRAGRLVSLIISDVPGDPLEVIASGPTVADSSTPQDALDMLEQFGARRSGIAPAVFTYLQKAANRSAVDHNVSIKPICCVTNLIIANNATAVAAAGQEAQRLGYSVSTTSATQSEGQVEQIGRDLAATALRMRAASGPSCLVSGGEPVVKLVEAPRRGLGGRNQQLALAAVVRLADDGAAGIALLSAGTDGEDGPTNAAGALVDAEVLTAAQHLGLDAGYYLACNDAYHFFAQLDALIRTGPTQTNVCDLRVVVTAGD
jgi:hydroxypyruvate reductase